MNSRKQLRRTRRFGSRVSSEQLERRMLLTVSASQYDSIRLSYTAFNLPADMADINIIEIASSDLTAANLKAAIQTAATTDSDDLIVIRTPDTENTITYTSSDDEISIDIPSSKGALSIVGYGGNGLTLDAAGFSRVLTVGTQESTTVVNLGGISMTGGQAGDSGNGGGLYQGGGVLTLQYAGIGENTATGDGGGMYQEAGQSTVVSTSFWDNSAGGNGGGMYLHSGLSVMTTVVRFDWNFAAEDGGGVCLAGGTLSMEGAHLEYNRARHDAGGLYQSGSSSLELINSVIRGNDSAYTGGMVQNGGSSTLSNVTAVANPSGGISLLFGHLTLNNSIVAGNTDSLGHDVYVSDVSVFPDEPGFLEAHNSLIGNGVGQSVLTNGVNGNLVGTASAPIDPLFVEVIGTSDLCLAKDSPAVDAGDNTLIPSGVTTDASIRPRILGGTVDMGAYERGLDLVINGTDGDDQILLQRVSILTGGLEPEVSLLIMVNGTATNYLLAALGSVTLNGLAGNDTIGFSEVTIACTVSGGLGNDLIYGGRRADSLHGDDGDDTIYGGFSEDDTIMGGAGNDSLAGSIGNDTIMGNTGNDTLVGAEGDDLLQGGLGNDSLSGGPENDTLYGGDGTDLIDGGEGDDYVEGKGKADAIHGGAGNDTIFGGAGADLIYGDDGNDQIDVGRSSAFADSVYGGAGTDSVLADSSDVLDADIESVLLA